jgi:anti-sigma regulatory factor (Ser/Thr protein kinase)
MSAVLVPRAELPVQRQKPVWTVHFEPSPSHRPGRLARELLRCGLRGFDPDTVHTAELLATELLTNALTHTGRFTAFHAARYGQLLLVTVTDQALEFPDRVSVDQDLCAESGRGLPLVEALADTWGVHLPTGSVKAVWFLLRLGGPAQW